MVLDMGPLDWESSVLTTRSLLLTLLLVSVFGQTGKTFLLMFHELLPRTHVTNIGLISLDSWERVFMEHNLLI